MTNISIIETTERCYIVEGTNLTFGWVFLKFFFIFLGYPRNLRITEDSWEQTSTVWLY